MGNFQFFSVSVGPIVRKEFPSHMPLAGTGSRVEDVVVEVDVLG